MSEIEERAQLTVMPDREDGPRGKIAHVHELRNVMPVDRRSVPEIEHIAKETGTRVLR